MFEWNSPWYWLCFRVRMMLSTSVALWQGRLGDASTTSLSQLSAPHRLQARLSCDSAPDQLRALWPASAWLRRWAPRRLTRRTPTDGIQAGTGSLAQPALHLEGAPHSVRGAVRKYWRLAVRFFSGTTAVCYVLMYLCAGHSLCFLPSWSEQEVA